MSKTLAWKVYLTEAFSKVHPRFDEVDTTIFLDDLSINGNGAPFYNSYAHHRTPVIPHFDTYVPVAGHTP